MLLKMMLEWMTQNRHEHHSIIDGLRKHNWRAQGQTQDRQSQHHNLMMKGNMPGTCSHQSCFAFMMAVMISIFRPIARCSGTLPISAPTHWPNSMLEFDILAKAFSKFWRASSTLPSLSPVLARLAPLTLLAAGWVTGWAADGVAVADPVARPTGVDQRHEAGGVTTPPDIAVKYTPIRNQLAHKMDHICGLSLPFAYELTAPISIARHGLSPATR